MGLASVRDAQLSKMVPTTRHNRIFALGTLRSAWSGTYFEVYITQLPDIPGGAAKKSVEFPVSASPAKEVLKTRK